MKPDVSGALKLDERIEEIYSRCKIAISTEDFPYWYGYVSGLSDAHLTQPSDVNRPNAQRDFEQGFADGEGERKRLLGNE